MKSAAAVLVFALIWPAGGTERPRKEGSVSASPKPRQILGYIMKDVPIYEPDVPWTKSLPKVDGWNTARGTRLHRSGGMFSAPKLEFHADSVRLSGTARIGFWSTASPHRLQQKGPDAVRIRFRVKSGRVRAFTRYWVDCYKYVEAAAGETANLEGALEQVTGQGQALILQALDGEAEIEDLEVKSK